MKTVIHIIRITLLITIICVLSACGEDVQGEHLTNFPSEETEKSGTTMQKSLLKYVEYEDEFQISLTDEQINNLKSASYSILSEDDENEEQYYTIINGCRLEPDENHILHISKTQQLCSLYVEKEDSYVFIPRMEELVEDGSVKQSTEHFLLNECSEDQWSKNLVMKLQFDLDSNSDHLSYVMKPRDIVGVNPAAEEMALRYWNYATRMWVSCNPVYDFENHIQPCTEWNGSVYWMDSYDFDDLSSLTFSQVKSDYYEDDFLCQVILTFQDDTTLATDLMTLQDKRKSNQKIKTKKISTESGVLYFELDEKEAVLTDYEGEDECVNLPEIVDGVPVTGIDGGAFSQCDTLKEVILNEGLVSISEYAFTFCEMLETIRIPASVQEIQGGFYSNCPSLTCLKVDENNPYYKIKNQALLTFDGKKLIAALPISGKYIIPDSVEEICEDAFSDENELLEVVFPDSLIKIGADAFSGTRLTDITFPESLEYIGSHAFSAEIHSTSDIAEIASVSIGKNVHWIGEGAFNGYYIGEFDVDTGNPWLSSENGMIFNREKTFLCLCPTGKNGTLQILEGVENISREAFSNNGGFKDIVKQYTGITNLILPDSLKYFDSTYLPDNLEKLNVGKGLEDWKYPEDCRDVSLTISTNNSCYCMEDGTLFNYDKTELLVYMGDPDITSYKIPETIRKISSGAFSNGWLVEINIPAAVSLEEMELSELTNCFQGLSALKNITVENGNSSLYSVDGVLYNADQSILICYPRGKSNTEFTIPEGVERICADAFSYNSLEKLVLPSTLKAMRLSGEVYDCLEYSFHNLKEVALNDVNPYYSAEGPFVVSIAEQKLIFFSENYDDFSVTIPSGVVTIADGIFSQLDNSVVSEIYIPEGVTTIEADNFNNISQEDQWDILDIYLPDSITTLSDDSFQDSPGIVLHASADNVCITEFVKKYHIPFEEE